MYDFMRIALFPMAEVGPELEEVLLQRLMLELCGFSFVPYREA
jgi:hypothetical protein